MSKWIAEFDLEDGDTMPEHMDLEYKGAKLDFHCRPKYSPWIPVSERPPEEFQRVLVTIVNYKGDKIVRVAEYYSRKGKGVFQIKENHEQWEVGEKGLLAWKPLPEPYVPDNNVGEKEEE